ncbi:hypothetical protein [Streptomyces decoyicus]|uniref:hypothetical protein n=1 Tax=Streptomyces decoyicus TaxID=249567 RepID=UPI0038147E96
MDLLDPRMPEVSDGAARRSDGAALRAVAEGPTGCPPGCRQEPISEISEPEQAVRELIALANGSGSPGNIKGSQHTLRPAPRRLLAWLRRFHTRRGLALDAGLLRRARRLGGEFTHDWPRPGGVLRAGGCLGGGRRPRGVVQNMARIGRRLGLDRDRLLGTHRQAVTARP